MSFLKELRRRNVIRVAGLYLAGAWLIVQVAGTVLPIFDAPTWIARAILIALVVGFVPALVFAWAFEITPEGLKREKEIDRAQSITATTGRKLDRVIMVVLALALGYFAFDKFVLAPQREQAATETARQAGRSEAIVESYGDKSIAVLPFRNLSADREQEYFSDGISEELLNLLVKIPELRVISRTSSFSYKGKNLRLAQIAQELNVAHILEGSVRKAGNRVRITAQLTDARTDTQLWSETYDRPLDDIFAVQDEISGAVVSELRLKLLGSSPKAKPVDERAYSLYLQARSLYRQRTKNGGDQATLLFRQALEIEPNYAPAWAGLADNYMQQANLGYESYTASYSRAREAAEKALEVDPDLAEAHSILGYIAQARDTDFAAAARHYLRAIELEPNNTQLIGEVSTLELTIGNAEKYLDLNRFVISRDPLNVSALQRVAWVLYALRRPAEAISYLDSLDRLQPAYGISRSIRASVLLQLNDARGALESAQQESVPGFRKLSLAMAWHALGQRGKSDAALAELIRDHEQEMAYNIAYVLAFRGDADRAFEWLEKAVAYRDAGLQEILMEPAFDNIRNDPRWLPFLRKIKMAPEQLAKIELDIKLPQ